MIKDELKYLYNRIKSLIKIGLLKRVDTSESRMFYYGDFSGKKDVKIGAFIPYGDISNCPAPANLILFSQQAQESNQIGMADAPNLRFIKGKPGERGIFNGLTGAYVLLKEDGNIDISSLNGIISLISNKVLFNVVQFDIEGNIALIGNINIEGNLIIKGNVQITGDLIINGINFSTHRHIQDDPDPGITGVPI